jgi:hypothetical protein
VSFTIANAEKRKKIEGRETVLVLGKTETASDRLEHSKKRTAVPNFRSILWTTDEPGGNKNAPECWARFNSLEKVSPVEHNIT